MQYNLGAKPQNRAQDRVMKSTEPRSSSSCAACKFLKRRCVPNCIFAPYFLSDDPKKFAKVHKVFGASNVSKILVQVPEDQRQDAVNSLAYEAEARLKDPVYGCIGAIATLQKKMVQLQHDLALARARLARYNNNNVGLTSSGANSVPSSLSFVDVNDVMASLGGVRGGNGSFVSQSSPEGLSQRRSMDVGYGNSQSAPYIL